MSTFWYGIRQGFKGMFQNKIFTLAAIGTITACLFILGVFYSVFTNFKSMVYKAESSVGLTVFFDEDATDAQIQAIGELIKQQKGVKKVEFISAEEAWERFKSQKFEGNGDLAATFGTENPLANSESFEIYISNISLQSKIQKYITGLDGVRKVNGTGSAGSLSSFNMLIAYVSGTIIILLILVSVFLISSAVAMGISVRKDEIAIMKLIGATDAFVRLPFVIEGILMGVIGAAIPILILRIIYENVVNFISNQFSTISNWLTFISVDKIFAVLIPLSAGVGIGIGLLGSAVSVRKHLDV